MSVFVDGRLSEIRNLTPVSSWCFCPGNLNPADVGTRQVSFKKLDKFLPWVEGLKFLLKVESEWPCLPETDSSPEFSACLIKTENEVKPVRNLLLKLVNHYSDFNRLLRQFCYVIRVFSSIVNKTKILNIHKHPLTVAKLAYLEKICVKVVQHDYYAAL